MDNAHIPGGAGSEGFRRAPGFRLAPSGVFHLHAAPRDGMACSCSRRRSSREGEGAARAAVAGTGGRTEELSTRAGSFGAPLSPALLLLLPLALSWSRCLISLPCPVPPVPISSFSSLLLPLRLSPPFLLSSPHPCSSLGTCSSHLPCRLPALTPHSGLPRICSAWKSSTLDWISRLRFLQHLEQGLTLGSSTEKGAMMAGQVPTVD